MFRSGSPLSPGSPKGTSLSLSEDWLGGAGSLCEAEDKQHRCLSAASFDAARGEQLRLPAGETLERRGREVPLIFDASFFLTRSNRSDDRDIFPGDYCFAKYLHIGPLLRPQIHSRTGQIRFFIGSFGWYQDTYSATVPHEIFLRHTQDIARSDLPNP